MRFFTFLFSLFFCFVFSVQSGAAAGLWLLDLPSQNDLPSMKAAIWSPCAAEPAQTRVGPFVLSVTRDCPIPEGRYPLVVMSHGFAGTYFSHRDTAAALADSGFIVAAINHPGDSALDMKRAGEISALVDRPADIVRLLDHVLNNWTAKNAIDAERIGVFGFSRGAYAALVLAGGVPDFRDMPCQDVQAAICTQMLAKTLAPEWLVHDRRVKSVVLADPPNAFPAARDLENIKLPIQLWRSQRGGDGVLPENVARLAQNLPTAPDFRSVEGAGHFSFITPCPAEMAKALPQICGDMPGFDREGFHHGFNADVAAFFKTSLR